MELENLLRQAQKVIGKKPNISKLLSPSPETSVKEKVKVKGTTYTHIYQLWVAKYMQAGLGKYVVNVAQKAMIKRLVVEFGEDEVIKAICYYLENWKSIPYIQGYPSIPALVGFRYSLFPESKNGKRPTEKKGQFSEAKEPEREDALWR